MIKFTIFIAFAFFGTSLAWPFDGGRFPPQGFPNSGEFREGGEGRGRGEEGFPRPPAPTFLRDVNQTERHAWFQIEHNRNATKAEIQSQQDQWAANQTSEVQQAYNDYKEEKSEFVQNITAKADELAANLSQEAQNIYNQVKEIIQNQDISQAEECDQIREALSNATREVRRELKPFKKMIGKKCHHKRGPFGGPRHGGGPFGFGGPGFGGPREGGFGGPGFGNGEFGGPRGGFGFGNGGFGFGNGEFGGPRGFNNGPRGRDSESDEDNFDGPRRGGFEGGRRDSNENSGPRNSNSNEDNNSDSDEYRPRPSRRPRPTGFPIFTDIPLDGATDENDNQFPTIQPSSTTSGGFFRNLFRF